MDKTIFNDGTFDHRSHEILDRIPNVGDSVEISGYEFRYSIPLKEHGLIEIIWDECARTRKAKRISLNG